MKFELICFIEIYDQTKTKIKKYQYLKLKSN